MFSPFARLKGGFPAQRSSVLLAAGVLGLALLIPAELVAQLPQFDQASEGIKEAIRPIVGIAQWVLVALAFFLGLWTAFKAAKGDARSWLPAILLFIVAGVAWVPTLFLNTIGLTDLANALGDLGFQR